jgi:hypothetical protein
VVVVSVDLAYKKYRDIGIAVLASNKGNTVCEFVRHSMQGVPEPMTLARYLSDLCTERQSDLLLLDGPQGWKDPDNGLPHSRVCERKLNTPAKTGLPGSVKPANYGPFVTFSIRVYDCLSELGWTRFSSENRELDGSQRLLVESFPLSAWRTLGIQSLPAKRKTQQTDLADRLRDLMGMFDIHVSEAPSHDELQALVSGLAGVCIERKDWSRCEVVGEGPFELDGTWREGVIVNALRPPAFSS